MSNLKEEDIIDLFLILINDFFDLINEYIDVNQLENHNLFLITGISVLRNSFEYTLIKKKDLANTKIYCERTIYYYLEYIKQTLELDEMCLNYRKISIFINSKILNEINENNETDSLILSLSEEKIINKNIDIKKMIEDADIFINNLFNWNNNNKINYYHELSNNHLNMLKKNFKNINTINNYIILLKEKIHIADNENIKLISSICNFIAINKKKNNEYLNIIKKFYINEELLKEKYEKLNLNDFINWLICYNNHE